MVVKNKNKNTVEIGAHDCYYLVELLVSSWKPDTEICSCVVTLMCMKI